MWLDPDKKEGAKPASGDEDIQGTAITSGHCELSVESKRFLWGVIEAVFPLPSFCKGSSYGCWLELLAENRAAQERK